MGLSVNKDQLAGRLQVSLPTLTRWIVRFGQDFPVIERGGLGKAWLFDPAAVFDFLRERQAAQLADQAQRDEELSQLKLPFDVPVENAPAGKLSVKDELEAWKLRKVQREEAERAGQLVPAAQVADALAGVFARLSRDMHAFVRQIGREDHWPESRARDVERRLADMQHGTVAELDAMLSGQGDERRRRAG